MSVTLEQRIRGSFFGGAKGDALGSVIEDKKLFSEIQQAHGPQGVQEFQFYTSAWYPKTAPSGIGALTDDTTMTMGSAWSMILAADTKAQGHDLVNKATYYAHQNYLNWGAKQEDADGLIKAINPAVSWPQEAQEFWFTCDAGRGTIAMLNTMCMGTPNDPVKAIIPTRTEEPVVNIGSGALMRVAPLGFWSGFRNVNVVDLTQRNAALTHGGDDVMKTALFVTKMISHAAHDVPLHDALAQEAIYFYNGNKASDKAFRHAREKSQDDASIEAIDAIPQELGYENKFLVNPIFSQVVYVLFQAAKNPAPTPEDFKNSMRLAVNHGGDSDTVAAIAGNIIGAFHPEALAEDWIDKLQHRDAIEKTATAFAEQLRLG